MFGRNRKLIPGQSTGVQPQIQHYVLSCLHGHDLHGTRTESYQALRCPTCGSGIFVLPRSPLPDLPPVSADDEPSTRTAFQKGAREAAALQDSPIEYSDVPAGARTGCGSKKIVWLDEDSSQDASEPLSLSDEEILAEYQSPSQPVPAGRSQTAEPPASGSDHRSAAPRTSRDSRRGRGDAADQADEFDEVEDHDSDDLAYEPFKVRLARWAVRRKGLLSVLTVIGVVCSTLAYNAWRPYREQLPHTAEVNFVEGMEAFEQADYDQAKLKLGRAAASFKTLGSRDERTSLAVQFAAEAAIFADLCTYRLDEILDEAARTDAEAWKRRFEIAYKGRAIILDTEIEGPPPPGASAGAYPLLYRVLLGRGPTPSKIGRIDLQQFKLFEGQSLKEGDSVLFGARLAGCQLEGGEWKFSLEPESGVLLTRFENLKRQGWSPRETISIEASAARSPAP